MGCAVTDMIRIQEKLPKDPSQRGNKEAGIFLCCAVTDMKHLQEKMPNGTSHREQREAGILIVLCCDSYETLAGEDAEWYKPKGEKGGWDFDCVVLFDIKHMQEQIPTGTGTSPRHGVRLEDRGMFVFLLCCGLHHRHAGTYSDWYRDKSAAWGEAEGH